MRMKKAMEIIAHGLNPGFVVSFDWKDGSLLRSDYFPDIGSGEQPIESEGEAWELARKFASKTTGKCVNIYVIRRSDFVPVDGYRARMIENR